VGSRDKCLKGWGKDGLSSGGISTRKLGGKGPGEREGKKKGPRGKERFLVGILRHWVARIRFQKTVYFGRLILGAVASGGKSEARRCGTKKERKERFKSARGLVLTERGV